MNGLVNRNIPPADELGHIREEIRRLKAREAELRQQILETGDASGTDYTVEIREQTRRTFDRTALPQPIQDDPAYWKISTTRLVKTVPLTPAEPLIDDGDI
ncbi:MAG: hypothetical protein AAGK00_10750 [Pseudomonadota bacterium]